MKAAEILDDFNELLRGLLADDTIELTTSTVRNDVPGWDSFQYVNFIVGVETRFDIKFRVADVESFDTVGDIVNETLALVDRH